MFRNLVQRASWTNYRPRILWQSTHHLEVSHPNQGCWINWSHLKDSRNVHVIWWGNCRLSWSWWNAPILGMFQSRQIQVKERDEIIWKRSTHNFYENDSMSISKSFLLPFIIPSLGSGHNYYIFPFVRYWIKLNAIYVRSLVWSKNVQSRWSWKKK